jgi:hypothetical protein
VEVCSSYKPSNVASYPSDIPVSKFAFKINLYRYTTATLLYRQFAEALVRAAHVKFHNLPGLDRRVNKLITEHLLAGAENTLPWWGCTS